MSISLLVRAITLPFLCVAALADPRNITSGTVIADEKPYYDQPQIVRHPSGTWVSLLAFAKSVQFRIIRTRGHRTNRSVCSLVHRERATQRRTCM